MDASALSTGAIQACVQGNGPPRPRLQVLGIKKITSEKSTGDRFRLQLSDGIHYQPGMLATQMNEKITSNELDKLCIIQVEKMIVNTVQNRKIMVLINVTVLHKGSEVGSMLGQPKNLEIKMCENGSSAQQISKPQPSVPYNNRPPLGNNQPSRSTFGNPVPPPSAPIEHKTPPKKFYGGTTGGGGGFRATPSSGKSPISGRNVFPIASLNPYQNKWTIKARVTSKPNIRNYSNSRGEGRIMSVELVDQSGEIRATGFNEDADRLYPLMDVNKIYYISRGRLRPANKQYTSCNNDYELMFSNDTMVEECLEGGSELPSMSFNFVPISDLEQTPKDKVVDVIGVCAHCPDISTVTTRTTNKKLSKRDITLLDKSGKSIQCTIWGTEAEGFDGSLHPVVALKGVRVSEFNGVTLSAVNSTMLCLNPDIPEAHHLKGWYDNYGKDQQSTSLSTQMSFGSSQAPFLTFQQVKAADIGRKEKPDYFNCKGTITYLRKDNIVYKACPSSDCNKKVSEDNSGRYHCEKCGQSYSDFKYRMIFKISVSDYGDNIWLDCFNEAGVVILGVDAQQIGEAKEKNDTTQFDQIIDEANFKDYILKVRAKMDTFNDEQRLRCSCVTLSPVNYAQETQRRLEEIKSIMNK